MSKLFSPHKRYYCKALFLLLLFPFNIHAQQTKKIEILNANSLEYNKSMGEDAKRLIGDVAMMHEGTTLYCDSAWFFSESNNVKAYGHVRIFTGSVKITADALTYDGNSKIAQLYRNVIMTDGQMTLHTDHLTYNTQTDVANYSTGGRITDPENKLTSLIGYYYSDDKLYFFKKNVVLINPKYTMHSDTLRYNTETKIAYFFGPTTIVSKQNFIYCENGWYNTVNDIAQFNKNAYFKNQEQRINGDSLYYDRKIGLGKAFNNTTAIDSVRKIVLKGNYAEYYEKAGKTMITKHALLIQDMDGDSLFLHSDTLKAFFDTTGTGKTILAYHHAKFFKSDMQGLGDSLVYSFKDSTIFMYVNPMLWTAKNQLSADTILIFLSNKQVRQINLYKSSFIIGQDDSVRFNQVKGRNLIGYFTDNHLKKIVVKGNGETMYYVRDEKNGIIGVNNALADDLLIFTNDNKIKTITFNSKPDANLYPEKSLSPTEARLKDFHWEIIKRPLNKESVFFW